MQTQLRVHPKLKFKGITSWPPDWGGAYEPSDAFPIGEQGTLKEVEIVGPDYVGPRRLELTIEYHGQKHSGQIWVDDESIVLKLKRLLDRHVDEPLEEIGATPAEL